MKDKLYEEEGIRPQQQYLVYKGNYHFLPEGVPNLGLQKSASIKLRQPPPPFWQPKFYDPPPHHQYTLPPKQAKIVLKTVFLNKTLKWGHLVILYTFWSKFYDPPIFLSKYL